MANNVPHGDVLSGSISAVDEDPFRDPGLYEVRKPLGKVFNQSRIPNWADDINVEGVNDFGGFPFSVDHHQGIKPATPKSV